MPHEIRLEPIAASPGDARLFVSQWARSWGYRPLIAAAALLTSELATNAVLHTADRFVVEVANTGHGLRVVVRDSSPEPPVVRPPQQVGAHGRGMRLVDAVSTTWGSERIRDNGKDVWFELDVADPHGHLV